MRKHEMEKALLVERLKEQSETVHHLTHHVHLLQSGQLGDNVDLPEDLHLPPPGTFGGKHPVFFPKQSQQTRASGVVTSSNTGIGNDRQRSDQIDHFNSVNMSQLSTSFGQGASFVTTAPPPGTLRSHDQNLTSTAVKNGLHELYQHNRHLYEKTTQGTPYLHAGSVDMAEPEPERASSRFDPHGLSRGEEKSSIWEGEERRRQHPQRQSRDNMYNLPAMSKDSPTIRPMISTAHTPFAATYTRVDLRDTYRDNEGEGHGQSNRGGEVFSQSAAHNKQERNSSYDQKRADTER